MVWDSLSEMAMSLSGVWIAFSVEVELDCGAAILLFVLDDALSVIDTCWVGVSCELILPSPA